MSAWSKLLVGMLGASMLASTAPITAEQIAHEIVMLKATGTAPPDVDKFDPASMVFR